MYLFKTQLEENASLVKKKKKKKIQTAMSEAAKPDDFQLLQRVIISPTVLKGLGSWQTNTFSPANQIQRCSTPAKNKDS